jgi:hypothetical protein
MADSGSWVQTDEAELQTIANPLGESLHRIEPVSSVKRSADRATATEALARVRKWRARAEECRSLAESMSSDPARHTLHQLAVDYEALADSWEQAARHRGERERVRPRVS